MPRAILEAIHTNEFRFLVLVKVPKPEKPKKRENKDKKLMMIFDITENIIPTKIRPTSKARLAIFVASTSVSRAPDHPWSYP